MQTTGLRSDPEFLSSLKKGVKKTYIEKEDGVFYTPLLTYPA